MYKFDDILIWLTKIAGAIAAITLLLFNIKRIFKFIYTLLFVLPESIKSIEKELKPNGGSSLRDAIKRIENAQILQEQRLMLILDSNPEIGVFETDELGNCTRVNNTYCRILNKTPEECYGMGWTTALHPDDKEKVFNEWNLAVKYSRPFEGEYRFIRTHGIPFNVKGKAFPIFNKDGKVFAWIGTITIIS